MSRPTFNSYYRSKNPVVSTAGDCMETEFELVVDDYGVERLREVGETDLHAFIQSHAASVDLHAIIERAQLGDSSALEKVNGFYADVSDLQMNLSEFMNLNNKSKRFFESLPLEVRNAFDNSYIEFVNHPEKFNELYPQPTEDIPFDESDASVQPVEDVTADA